MPKTDSTLTTQIAGKFTSGSDQWTGQEVEDSFLDLVDNKINNDKIGAASGVASLDSNTKLTISQLPKLQNQPLGWFNVEDYGAVHDGVTDDTASIQSAIQAAFDNGGGVVFFPLPADGDDYVIAGNLQTSINSTNPNSQLYIPLTRFGVDEGVHIELRGESPPNYLVNQVSGGINNGTRAVILRSTITGSGTTPAVFGTPTYTGTFTSRSHTYVTFRNLIIRTRTNTGATHYAGAMSGINFAKLSNFQCDNLSVETTSTLDIMAEPTGETYGVIFPEELNFAFLHVGCLRILGYKYGFVPGEHLRAGSIYISWCKNGMYLKNPQQHGAIIQRLSIEATYRMILLADDNPILINQFCPEFVNSGSLPAWCWTDNIVYVSGSPTVPIHIDHVNVGHAFVGGTYEGFPCNDYSKVSCNFFNQRNVNRDAITLVTGDTWGVFRAKKANISLVSNTTITMAEMASGDTVDLMYTQDATGGRTLTIGGAACTITGTANATGRVTGMYNGTAWYFKNV